MLKGSMNENFKKYSILLRDALPILLFEATGNRALSYSLFRHFQRVKKENEIKRTVKNIYDISSSISLIGLGIFGSPITGLLGVGFMNLIEKTDVVETLTDKVLKVWQNLDSRTKEKLVITSIIAGSSSIILLASALVPSTVDKRGGVELLRPAVRIVGEGIEVLVDQEFCQRIFAYFLANPLNANFDAPSITTSLLIETVKLINKKIINNENIGYINPASLYALMELCLNQK
jgi:hypothetical protein